MASDTDPPNVRYRRLAQECLDVAHGIITPETRAALIARAQYWLRLAEEREPRPVTQQQQQIQPKEPEGDGK
jgi:hypothetical protein